MSVLMVKYEEVLEIKESLTYYISYNPYLIYRKSVAKASFPNAITFFVLSQNIQPHTMEWGAN